MGKSKKRKSEAVTDDVSPSHKRPRPSPPRAANDEDPASPNVHQPRADPSTGLRSAFPGLDHDGNDDELFYGPASNGFEYLRMVRSEAKAVPKLLVAPTHAVAVDDGAINDSVEDQDARGYYADGAYTAAPTVAQDAAPDEATTGTELPQDIYRQSLLLRYRLLRANLRITPPADVIAALDDDHPIMLSKQAQAGRFRWQELLRQTDPLPAQVAAMDQSTVLRLIGVIATGRFLKRRANLPSRLSRWIWALLGRIEEIGCLNNDEVAVLRDLGKRAASVSRGAYQVEDDAWEDPDAVYEDEAHQDIDEPTVESPSEIIEELADVKEDESLTTAAPEHQAEQTSRNEQGITDATNDNGTSRGKPHKTGSSLDVQNRGPESTDSTDTEAIETIKERVLASITLVDDEREEGELSSPSAKVVEPQEALNSESEEGEIGESLEEEEENDERFPSSNTLATLDMILTIVGEVYGQRDLLEWRQTWQ